jgi:hypothetical protein
MREVSIPTYTSPNVSATRPPATQTLTQAPSYDTTMTRPPVYPSYYWPPYTATYPPRGWETPPPPPWIQQSGPSVPQQYTPPNTASTPETFPTYPQKQELSSPPRTSFEPSQEARPTTRRTALTATERDEEALVNLVRQFIRNNPEWRNWVPPGTIEELSAAVSNPAEMKQILTRLVLKNALNTDTAAKHFQKSGFIGRMMEKTVLKFIPPPLDSIAQEFISQARGGK